jgi:guanine deaminase
VAADGGFRGEHLRRYGFRAGDEWPVPQVLNAAFKSHMSETGEAAVSLHPAEMLFIGTLGGARALDVEDRFGNFDIGKEADFVVDPSRTPSLQAVLAHAVRSDDTTTARDQTLFGLLMGMRETSVAATYVQGRRLPP